MYHQDHYEDTKIEIKISGNVFSDMNRMRAFMFAEEWKSIVNDVDQMIRDRLKYCEGMTETEVNFLEEIRRTIGEMKCIDLYE